MKKILSKLKEALPTLGLIAYLSIMAIISSAIVVFPIAIAVTLSPWWIILEILFLPLAIIITLCIDKKQ